MLQLDKTIILPEVDGVTIYTDDRSESTYYMLADSPRFRIENGTPVFKFIKYRNPIDRQNGKRGGGYVFFDATFDVPKDKKDAAIDGLQQRLNKIRANRGLPPAPVTIGEIPWTKGSAKLVMEAADGTMIEKIWSPGKPSLFGRNIATFTMELSAEGATLFEQALQGKGGVVSIVYDLFTFVKLPPIKVVGHFSSEKFYSFSQTIDTEWNVWAEDSYQETIREQFRDSSSYTLDFDWGAMTDQKTKDQIRDWATRTMEDNIEKKMIEAIAPVSADDRKKPDGIEDVTRNISTQKIASFDLRFKEGVTMDWNPAPQGILPNITNLTGPDGKPLKWEDYARTIDLDDPFFKMLNVTMIVNADFTNLPIHSVEMLIKYPGADPKEFSISKVEDRPNYQAFLVNNSFKYTYSYVVNYKGSSKTFKSKPTETEENVLTVNVDDLGYMNIAVRAGDINFEQVNKALVTISYEDNANDIDKFEDVFTIDADHLEHSFEKLLLVPVSNPYTYQIKYFMKGGKEYSVKPREGNSRTLFIEDPFVDFKDIMIRAGGNLDTEIDNILLDLQYDEPDNNYRQNKQIELSKANPFGEWSIPIIDSKSGKVTYSGTIRYKSGLSEDIPITTAERNSIIVGPQVEKVLKVQVLPDLLDFKRVKLAKITLHYTDTVNDIDEVIDCIFRPGATAPFEWTVNLKDKQNSKFSWEANYFLVDGSVKRPTRVTTDELTILPELPV
ncbi:hypothetical protein [Flavitalea sp.]|nr:hypothetical protein [Flavitalea sp.]